MNPFEKFLNVPTPNDSKQFESTEQSQKRQLVAEAVIKLEGDLEFFFKNEQRGSSLEQTAALWASQTTRGISSLDDKDSSEFTKILHNLYI